jgi:outer membrane protein assembly factor BamB
MGNTSFVDVKTSIGVVPRWSLQLEGTVEWGGPALGADGTIYLGTSNGRFHAVWPDGSLRCSVGFRDGIFTSTPAVLPTGDVAILLNRRVGEQVQGALVLLSADCKPLWERELPRWNMELQSIALGSVKVWSDRRSGATFLFVHSRFTRQRDITVPRALTSNELLAYTPDGQLFARHPVGQSCIDVSGGGGLAEDIWDFIGDHFVVDTSDIPPLYQQFAWPASSPAIMDSEIQGFSTPAEPLVAVTDAQDGCEPELNVLQFLPAAATVESRLRMTWFKVLDHTDRAQLSSPAVLPEGKIVVGSSTHRLRLYDLPSQALVWEKDTKEPVMHPPAMTPGTYFTITDYKGWLYSPVGQLIVTQRVQPMKTGGSLAASAASSTQAFVPGFEGLKVWSHDLQDIAHPLQDESLFTSNPALSAGGRVYIVGQRDGRGTLYAFGPP